MRERASDLAPPDTSTNAEEFNLTSKALIVMEPPFNNSSSLPSFYEVKRSSTRMPAVEMVAFEPSMKTPRSAFGIGVPETEELARLLSWESERFGDEKETLADGAMMEPLMVILEALKLSEPRLKVVRLVFWGSKMEPSGLLKLRLLKPLVVSKSGFM